MIIMFIVIITIIKIIDKKTNCMVIVGKEEVRNKL